MRTPRLLVAAVAAVFPLSGCAGHGGFMAYMVVSGPDYVARWAPIYINTDTYMVDSTDYPVDVTFNLNIDQVVGSGAIGVNGLGDQWDFRFYGPTTDHKPSQFSFGDLGTYVFTGEMVSCYLPASPTSTCYAPTQSGDSHATTVQ